MKSDLMRRASLVVGAALLVLALVILAVGPRTTFRAETSFTVSRPLLATDVVAELRLADVNARLTGAQGVDADTTADDRTKARLRIVDVVQRAVDACVVTASTAATQRAAASQVIGNTAKTEAAAVTAASGVSQPQRAYQQVRAELNRLEGARDAAHARGRPVADLDIRIASTQQKMFDLEFLVSRLAALAQEQQRAAEDSAAATQAANDAHAAAELTTRDLRVGVRRSGGWQGTAFAIAVFGVVIAAIPTVARRRARPRRSRRFDVPRWSGVPPAPMSAEDAILVEETLARARARRAAALGLDDGQPSVGNGSEPHIDLIAAEEAETCQQDAERPIGGA